MFIFTVQRWPPGPEAHIVLACLPAPGRGSAGPGAWWDDTAPDSPRSPSWLHLEKPPRRRRGSSRSRRCGATSRRWWGKAASPPGGSKHVIHTLASLQKRKTNRPYRWSGSPSGCSPTLWGPARWLDQGRRRRMACPLPGMRWIWATCTRWGRTSLANSSSLLHTCSWSSWGRWAGTYPEVCFPVDLSRREREEGEKNRFWKVKPFFHSCHMLEIYRGIIHYTTNPQSWRSRFALILHVKSVTGGLEMGLSGSCPWCAPASHLSTNAKASFLVPKGGCVLSCI